METNIVIMYTYKKREKLFIILFLCTATLSFSQVGINTTEPRKTLEVAGDVIISNSIEIGVKRAMTDTDDSTFLIQDTDNKIKSLDVSNPTNDALGYIQEYIIYNPDGDWVLNFNTLIDANLFDVISISAYYDTELVLGGSSPNFSLPYTAAFVEDNTWRLIADFPSASNRTITPKPIGTWTITTLIFSKGLSKQLGTVRIPMGDSTTGAATTPIIN